MAWTDPDSPRVMSERSGMVVVHGQAPSPTPTDRNRGDMSQQSCATCSAFVQLPSEDRPRCHLYPPLVPVHTGPAMGPLAINTVSAGLTHVEYRGPRNPDGWCAQWSPRES